MRRHKTGPVSASTGKMRPNKYNDKDFFVVVLFCFVVVGFFFFSYYYYFVLLWAKECLSSLLFPIAALPSGQKMLLFYKQTV